MTLKPSKKKHKKKQQNKKTKKEKKEKKNKKTKNTQKWAFQLSVKNFLLFWVGVQNLPCFDNLTQKARTLKTL